MGASEGETKTMKVEVTRELDDIKDRLSRLAGTADDTLEQLRGLVNGILGNEVEYASTSTITWTNPGVISGNFIRVEGGSCISSPPGKTQQLREALTGLELKMRSISAQVERLESL